MKKIFISDNSYVGFDTEDESLFPVTFAREGISRIFLVEEPVTIVVKRNGKDYELNAKKDDIVISFYEQLYDMPVIVVKNKDWAKNIKKYNKAMEELSKSMEQGNVECAETYECWNKAS